MSPSIRHQPKKQALTKKDPFPHQIHYYKGLIHGFTDLAFFKRPCATGAEKKCVVLRIQDEWNLIVRTSESLFSHYGNDSQWDRKLVSSPQRVKSRAVTYDVTQGTSLSKGGARVGTYPVLSLPIPVPDAKVFQPKRGSSPLHKGLSVH